MTSKCVSSSTNSAQLAASQLVLFAELCSQPVWYHLVGSEQWQFNQPWFSLTKLTPDADCWNAIVSEHRESLRAFITQLTSGDPLSHETLTVQVTLPSGEQQAHQLSPLVMRSDQGEIVGWALLFRVLESVQKATENTDLLASHSSSMRTIIETIPHLVWRASADGHNDYASERFCEFVEFSFEQVRGLGWVDLLYEDDREYVLNAWQEARDAGLPIKMDFRIVTGARKLLRWVRTEGNPYFNDQGKVISYYGTWTDITEQKKAETERRRANELLVSSEALFRMLVDNSPVIMWIADSDSRCTYLSKQWYIATGREVVDYPGFSWIDDVHPEDQPVASSVFMNAVAARGRLNCRYRLRQRDSSFRWYSSTGLPLFDENGTFCGYIGTVVDIDEQVNFERDLLALRERFERAATATNLGVYYCDLPFSYLNWNNEAKQHHFIETQGLVSKEFFFQHVHSEDRARVERSISNAIVTRQICDETYRTIPCTGSEKVKWIRSIGWVDCGGGDVPIRFDGITLDVTEEYLIRVELQKTREEAIQARHIAEAANSSKTRFLANMSHEIRTPLSAMIGFAELLRTQVTSTDSSASKYIDRISKNATHLAQLIDDLLDLSKIEADKLDVETESLEFSTLVDDTLAILRLKAEGKGLCLREVWNLPRKKIIATDRLRFTQILTNIIGNAIKFTESGGVTVEFSMSDDIVVIRVSDTGMGLSSEQRERLFMPFSQADSSVTRKFGGTGLGLVLSRRLARLLGGDLVLEKSEPNVGSVFRITIKNQVVNNAHLLKRKDTIISEQRYSLAGKRVLVVDDSADNRLIVGLYLQHCGAQVNEAENGADAVEKTKHDDVDIVIMDIQMPVMDGYEAMRTLKSMNFNKPIVALTAHAFEEERERCLRAGFSAYLTKPIQRRDLVASLVDLLNIH